MSKVKDFMHPSVGTYYQPETGKYFRLSKKETYDLSVTDSEGVPRPSGKQFSRYTYEDETGVYKKTAFPGKKFTAIKVGPL